MRVFVYEFITAGGFLDRPCGEIPGSLLAEGTALRDALVADFATLPGCDVCVLADARLPLPSDSNARVRCVRSTQEHDAAFVECSHSADWSLIVAPEFAGHLERLARCVIDVGGRLLGPPLAVIAVAADKQRLAEHLRARGMRAPRGVSLDADEALPRAFDYPAVLKPIDGCGSLGVQRVDRADGAHDRDPQIAARWRLEEHCEGIPASVAVLCGPRGNRPLLACRQTLSDDGRFTYLGGSLPLSETLNRRAQRLAMRAVQSLGDVIGYVGVDLALGADPTGTNDTVIEINPRLTTSYVGLRAACGTNLARAMIDIAVGRELDLAFNERRVRFDASGNVWQTEIVEHLP